MEKYPICNHRKETAPVVFGRTFVLCWRCAGVMISFLIMAVVRLLFFANFGSIQLWLGVFAMLPMIVDGARQYYLKKESTNKRRFITGVLFGTGFSFLVFIFY